MLLVMGLEVQNKLLPKEIAAVVDLDILRILWLYNPRNRNLTQKSLGIQITFIMLDKIFNLWLNNPVVVLIVSLVLMEINLINNL